MFGPNDPGYSVATMRAYRTNPDTWYARRGEAGALLGCAMGCIVSGKADDIKRAKRAVSHAMQIYMSTGLTQEQAANEIVTFAQTLAQLE